MGKNKIRNRSNKKNAGQQNAQPSGEPSSLRSSISGMTTATNVRTYDGTVEAPTPSSMSSYGPNVEAHHNPESKEQAEAPLPPRSRRRWWTRWIPRPCEWWPCRTWRWIRDFVVAFFRLFLTQYWLDQLHTLALMAIFVISFWAAIEGLLHMFKPVAAQDANCSIVYVTIPGPIITVSLVGATPSDPNHGTYYYSVINGTTHWLNSVAPPTRFSTLITTTAAGTTTPPMGLSSTPGLPPTAPGLPIISGLPSTGPSPPALSPIPPSSPVASPVPGTSLGLTTISGSTAIVVPSGGTPPGATPPLPLPPPTSITVPLPSIPPSGILGSSSATGQPPSSQPPPVVVTRTLTGPSGRLTTTATMTNGPNLPSSPALPPGISQSPPINSASVPIASSLGTIPSGSLGSATSPQGTPGSSSVPGVLPPISESSIPLQPTPGVPSIPSTSSASTIVFTTTSTASEGQIQTVTRSSITFVSGTAPLPPSSAIMSQPATLPSSGLVSMPPNTESSRFTVSVPAPSPSFGATTSNVATPPGSTVTATRVSSVNPPVSSAVGPSLTGSGSLPTSPGQPPLYPSSVQISSPNPPSESARVSSTGSQTTSMVASSLPTSLPIAPSESARLSSTGGPPTSLSTLSGSAPSLSLGLGTSPLSSIGGSSSGSGSIRSSACQSVIGTTSSTPAGNLPSSTPISNGPSRPSLPPVSTVTLTNSMSTLITTLTSSIAVPSSSLSSSAIASTQSPSPPWSTSTPSSTSIVTIPGVPTTPTPPVFLNTTSSLNMTSSSTLSSNSYNSMTSMSISLILSLTLSSLIPSSSMRNSSSNLASSAFISSSVTGSSGSTVFSIFVTTSSGSLMASSPLMMSSGSTISPSASTSPLITRISSSPGPGASSRPSDGWNGTALPILCSGSPNSPDCPSGIAAFTTKVVAYGDTEFSFVFPEPDITTTVSYWTGTHPSMTGPDWTSLPLTTRTARQTPLAGLPTLPSFELLQPTPSKSGFKTIVQTVVEPWTATPTGTKIAARAEPEEPAFCGEYGNFTLNFDDSTVGGANTDILPVTGMRNPYHHLFYANGFTYIPDKWEPYPAISQPNIAMFLPIGSSLLPNSPFARTLLPGELGAGPRASVDAYWFNAYSGYFGCALNGITPCTLRISGYRYDATLKQEVLAAEQNVTIPPCWGYINCKLTPVVFDAQFTALSGIQFNAFTYNLGIPQIFMMDGLQLEWWNNTCSAGILRIGHNS